ncbi:hypothetical protein QR680_013272 [Steinernema hermaphroditum]|uniref:Secreted protein n=1 Tax=Steinernema hermaphroditum TaxID=289476 RepID=A0AA39M287_9BILA|nr:hypothetical protein QR680_013272 [Steinernema hermaphroditum]
MTAAVGLATRLVALFALVHFAHPQRLFYDGKGYSNYEVGPVQVASRNFEQRVGPSRSADIDTDGIIAPIMQPIASLFDMYTQNKKALEYADKVEKERKTNLFDPEALLTALKLQTEAPPTEPPSFMERLLEPLVGPIRHELSKVTPTTPKPSFLDGFLANPAAPIVNSDAARRVESKPILPISSHFLGPENPLATLLASFGAGAPQRDEVQVGRDRTVSILGMPIGRRDGLNLNPTKGLSYGNQDLLGPIAVNDKYSVNWGFLDKIGNLIRTSTKQFGVATLAKLAAESQNKV